LAPAEAGVNQQPNIGRLQVGAIAS
jgi:hypothetical protein